VSNEIKNILRYNNFKSYLGKTVHDTQHKTNKKTRGPDTNM